MIINLTESNSHWRTRPLSELGVFDRGKSRHRPRNDQSLFEGGIYPFVQTGEIKSATLYIRAHTFSYNEKGLR
jgi:type I restriction enzyme S subunit